ncbi:MAG: hypothetical protein Q9195_005166 [Heterodermia aff. obscurata]
MAGIGEASAILAVAQIGISLSNTIIAYVSEVQDASFRIQRIGNEILTTSERLKDIGELVDRNHQTRIFSEEGVHSAVRCSEECHKILNELQSVLGKSGWYPRGKSEDTVEIDTSLFSTLRWPFIKTKLEVPRAELERIKLDLMLLFSSAMALGASSAAEKAKFRQDIPGLNRTRDWAARMEEQARKRALDRKREPRGRTRTVNEDFFEGDPEILQEFVHYQERRMREEDDKRLAERAAVLNAENEAKREKDEGERRALEQKILDKHKKEESARAAHRARMKNGLRDELQRAGLSMEQIETVLESPTSSLGEMWDAFTPANRPLRESMDDTLHKGKNNWRSRLPWHHGRSSQSHSSSPDPNHNSRPKDSNDGLASSALCFEDVEMQMWLLDIVSNKQSMLWSSEVFSRKELRKMLDNNGRVGQQIAKLKPLWRTHILQFLASKNSNNWSGDDWSISSVEVPHKSSRTRFLGYARDDPLIQVILMREKVQKLPPSLLKPSDQTLPTPPPAPVLLKESIGDSVTHRQAKDPIPTKVRHPRKARSAWKPENTTKLGQTTEGANVAKSSNVRDQPIYGAIRDHGEEYTNNHDPIVEINQVVEDGIVTSREYVYANAEERLKRRPRTLSEVLEDHNKRESTRQNVRSHGDMESATSERPRSRERYRHEEEFSYGRESTPRAPYRDYREADINRRVPGPRGGERNDEDRVVASNDSYERGPVEYSKERPREFHIAKKENEQPKTNLAATMLDGKTRVKGDDKAEHTGRRYEGGERFRVPTRTKETPDEHGRVPIHRRIRWKDDQESEDEALRAQARDLERKPTFEPRPTDEEFIDRTLERLTTFKPGQAPINTPVINNTAPILLTSPDVLPETNRNTVGTVKEATKSSVPLTHERSVSHRELFSSAGTSAGSPAGSHTSRTDELDRLHPLSLADSWRLSTENVTHGENMIVDELNAAAKAEMPTADDEEELSTPEGPVSAQQHDQPHEDARIESNGDQLAAGKAEPPSLKQVSNSRIGASTASSGHGSNSDEERIESRRRKKSRNVASRAAAKRQKAEKLLQEAEQLEKKSAILDGKMKQKQSIEMITPKSRVTTIEDFTPETEDRIDTVEYVEYNIAFSNEKEKA